MTKYTPYIIGHGNYRIKAILVRTTKNVKIITRLRNVGFYNSLPFTELPLSARRTWTYLSYSS